MRPAIDALPQSHKGIFHPRRAGIPLLARSHLNSVLPTVSLHAPSTCGFGNWHGWRRGHRHGSDPSSPMRAAITCTFTAWCGCRHASSHRQPKVSGGLAELTWSASIQTGARRTTPERPICPHLIRTTCHAANRRWRSRARRESFFRSRGVGAGSELFVCSLAFGWSPWWSRLRQERQP